MSEIKFSVIIPCYNGSAIIRRAVESCLVQTYPPFEVIIVDDGSDPLTVDVVKDLVAENQHKNVKAFFLKENSGVSVARNTGIKNATGDFICFLDADDLWHPEKLMRSKEFVTGGTNHLVLAHDFTYDLEDFKLPKATSGSFRRLTFFRLLFQNPIATPSLVIARKLGILFREDMRYVEDHELLLRLTKLCEIFFLDEKLLWINRAMGSKGGLSGDTVKMRRGELKMYFLLCKSDWRFYPLLPFLIAFSLSKHLRKIVLRSLRSS
jgi:teichuronic acid biosynthesis glycosyltransferase TuaG